MGLDLNTQGIGVGCEISSLDTDCVAQQVTFIEHFRDKPNMKQHKEDSFFCIPQLIDKKSSIEKSYPKIPKQNGASRGSMPCIADVAQELAYIVKRCEKEEGLLVRLSSDVLLVLRAAEDMLQEPTYFSPDVADKIFISMNALREISPQPFEMVGTIKKIEVILTERYRLNMLYNLKVWVSEESTLLSTEKQRHVQIVYESYLAKAVLDMLNVKGKHDIDETISRTWEDIQRCIHTIDQREDVESFDTDGEVSEQPATRNISLLQFASCGEDWEHDSESESSEQDLGSGWGETQMNDLKLDTTEAEGNISLERKHLKERVTTLCDSLPESQEMIGVRQLLQKMQYTLAEHVSYIVQIIVDRILCEGLKIDMDTFQWLIGRLMHEIGYYGPNEFIILFGAFQQHEWILEFVLLQLRKTMPITQLEMKSFRDAVIQCRSFPILPFLSQQIQAQNPDDLSLQLLLDVIQSVQHFMVDERMMNQLRELRLSSWPLRIQWFACLVKVQSLKITPEWTETDVYASTYYLFELRNRHGSELINTFMECLACQTTIDKDILLIVLHNLYRNKWLLTDETLDIILQDCHMWVESFDKAFNSQQSRNVNDLIDIMKRDSNNTSNIETLHAANILANKINERHNKRSRILQKRRSISTYNRQDISHWLEAYSNVETELVEVIAIIRQAIVIIEGFYLRDTQILALVLFFSSNDSGLLQQISTGEGKSVIIAALAIIKVLESKERVDILTSSPLLAQRDAQHFTELFALFGVSAGDNTSDILNERRKVYLESDIIYGEISSFQRDLLQDSFYEEDNGIGSRPIGWIIVDEVDSMLLDKGHAVLYLSHVIPGMDALEAVYVTIWNLVHSQDVDGSEDSIQKVVEAVHSAMYSVVRLDHMEESIRAVAECKYSPKQLLSILEKQEVIDNKGRMKRTADWFHERKILDQTEGLEGELCEVVTCKLKDILRQGTVISLPKHMEEFVDIHLRTWVENAFCARFMKLNESYVIDIDRSDNATRREPNIVIMDNDTGVEQYHSHWSNGLHQFLQLKHQCRMSLESLKAIFMSNIGFFRRYGQRLLGLTGTLGSYKEREFLKETYQVHYATLPTHKQSKFIEEAPVLCTDENNWVEQISQTIQQRPERPVLLVCENVLSVEKIVKHLPQNRKVHVYKRSYEPLLDDDESLNAPSIILATNLAGRGTDIKISEDINKKGGLHVCLTYLPSSVRVEEQAFGRTARKGQSGSGQIICLATDVEAGSLSMDTVVRLKIKRNLEEENHIDELKNNYLNVTKPEEDLFLEFKEVYKELERSLCNENERLRSLILRHAIDDWSFALDKANTVSKDISSDEDIKRLLGQLEKTSSSTAPHEFLNRPVYLLKYGKHLITQKEFVRAEHCLKQVAEQDCSIECIAHYYLCHSHLRRQGSRDSNLLYNHIFKAKAGFSARLEQISTLISTVDMVARAYEKGRQSFVAVNQYSAQKRALMKLYNIFMQSLDDITGNEVTSAMLETENIPFDEAHDLREKLLAKDVLNHPKLVRKYCETLREKYELHFPELVKAISSKTSNATVKAHTFENILPSREEFWDDLKKASVLTDDRRYVIVDEAQLKQYSDNSANKSKTITELLDYIKTKSNNDEFKSVFNGAKRKDEQEPMAVDTDDIHVCLFLEQLENIQEGKYKAIRLQEFEAACGDVNKWVTLRENHIIMENRVARLKVTNGVTLPKYDSLSAQDFMVVRGMEREVADEIFQDLCNNLKIITTEGKLAKEEINEFRLTRHRQYETEIMNVVLKQFRYRSSFEELVKAGCISLPSDPHLELFEDLISKRMIEIVPVEESVSEDKVKKILRKIIKTSQKDKANQDVDRLSQVILRSKCGLNKFDTVDSSIKPLEEYLDDKERFELAYEIIHFQDIGLSEVIVLIEQRWSWKAICGIAIVILLGMCQIALGLVIEIFSLGAGTFIASGFISEGIGDIMFGIECACTGYFSWKSYGINKAISLSFTVLTMGIGAYLSRGAKFSKFGFKIGGHHLQHLAGRKLIAEVGKMAILRQFAFRFTKKVATTAALALAQQGADALLERMQKHMIDKLSSYVVEKMDFGNVRNGITDLCKKFGVDRAKQMLVETGAKIFGPDSAMSQMMAKISSYITRAQGAFFDAIGKAANKARGNETLSMFSTIANSISKMMSYTEIGKSFVELTTMINRTISRLHCEILGHLSRDDVDLDVQVDQREIDSLSATTIGGWQRHISKEVSNKVAMEFVRPVLQNAAATVVHKTSKFIKDTYNSYQTNQQYERLFAAKRKKESLLALCKESNHDSATLKNDIMESYHNELTCLLEETRDPALFADIIRENVPVGIQCAQAVAEISGRPIQITYKDDPLASPLMFEPTCTDTSGCAPIIVQYELSSDGRAGHFTTISETTESSASSQTTDAQHINNNCLFDAVANSSGVPIDRNSVASQIETNPLIGEYISMGVHKHFMARKGLLGGVMRTPERQQEMNLYVRSIKLNEEPINRYALRDLGEKSHDNIKKTGNHELLITSQIEHWIKKNDTTEASNLGNDPKRKYDMVDVFLQMRVDTSYVAFSYTDQQGNVTLQSHTGAIYRVKKGQKFKKAQTKGQREYHAKLWEATKSGNSPKDVALKAMVTHLNETADGNQILNMKYKENSYTATGHNLKRKEDRVDYSRGVDRERYKIYLLAKSLNGGKQPAGLYKKPEALHKDWYCSNTKARIKEMTARQDFTSYGNEMMNPAPWRKDP